MKLAVLYDCISNPPQAEEETLLASLPGTVIDSYPGTILVEGERKEVEKVVPVGWSVYPAT